jgi:glutamine cyclotransferase
MLCSHFFGSIAASFSYFWSDLIHHMKRFYMLLSLFFLIACGNDGENGGTDEPVSKVPPPAQLTYTLVKEYPHDTSSYTQGLQYLGGFLYEGSGNPEKVDNKSKLRKIEIANGKVVKETFLKGQLFGEGITILGDKVYQLTYKEQKAFVYNLADFKLVKEFAYNTEGWGLTTDGTYLIMSDGSDLIYYRDPANFKEVKRISVQDNTGLRNNINELEYINGFIYANIYLTDDVVKIDPATGYIVGRIDFSALKKSYPELSGPNADVFNGIAWDSTGNRIFVTGKYWSKMFEVRLN